MNEESKPIMDEAVLGSEYADGEVICQQGERAERLFVVQEGRAAVFRVEGGVEVEVGELSAGDVFGEMAIVDNHPRSAMVRAKGKARVLTLEKKAFLRRVHEDPSLAFRILQGLSRHIRALDTEVALLRNIGSRVYLVRNLIILSRERADLFEQLSKDFSDDKEIEVVLDRRFGERRQRTVSHQTERRRTERRREPGVWRVELTEAYRSGRPRQRRV